MKLDLDEFCEQQGFPDFQIYTQVPRSTRMWEGPEGNTLHLSGEQ